MASENPMDGVKPAHAAWLKESAVRLASGEAVEFPRGLTWKDVGALHTLMETMPKSRIFMLSRETFEKFLADWREDNDDADAWFLENRP